MATPWTIRVQEDSEIGRQLQKALKSGQPVVLAIGETVLPVAANEMLPPPYDGDLSAGDLEQLKRQSAAFAAGHSDLDALAREQHVNMQATFDDLKGTFWPEADSVDEFIATLRRWRREG